MVYLGLDIGTSAIKALLIDEEQNALASAHTSQEWSSPHPGWAEQDPDSWWHATLSVIEMVRRSHPKAFAALRCVALSGHMHGATLLDAAGSPLRPAMLWNDTRSFAECAELEHAFPEIRSITGNLVMPGFTAPKLLWVRKHEPAVFESVRKVLLPKDYVAYRLSGDFTSDMSDASGTSWLDVGDRCWSPKLLAATGLSERAMPRLFEGGQAVAQVRKSLLQEWGIDHPVTLAAGAGDNAAAAVGMGVVRSGQALISLGTSGVMFAGNDRFLPNPEDGVHAFCHCLPGQWHQMAVTLSAASSLAWLSHVTGRTAEDLAAGAAGVDACSAPTFLPYLNGERTPYNDPHARGVFFGLSSSHSANELAYAVMEGVAFSMTDGKRSLENAGTELRDAFLVGGGSQSPFWAQLTANATGTRLHVPGLAHLGAAFGAARLALLGASSASTADVCAAPTTLRVYIPDPRAQDILRTRYERYRGLYASLRDHFQAFGQAR
jgi:xylulokinase